MVGEAIGDTREIRFRNMPRSLIPVMTPHGSLRLDQADDDFVPESGLADRLEKSFERGSAHGLLHTSARARLGASCRRHWRGGGISACASSPISARLAMRRGPPVRTELAAATSSEEKALAALIDDAPPMRGGEYLRPDVLAQHTSAPKRPARAPASLIETGNLPMVLVRCAEA